MVSGCKDKEIPIPNEEELITTLVLRLAPVSGGEEAIFTFLDTDGDGGLPPIITGEALAAGTTYDLAVTLRNDAEVPAIDITPEVEEEADEHQFFYSFEGVIAAFSYADEDGNGFPVGLRGRVETGQAGSGTLTVILRHLPVKDAPGVAGGDITQAGGETDIEVTFPVFIE